MILPCQRRGGLDIEGESVDLWGCTIDVTQLHHLPNGIVLGYVTSSLGALILLFFPSQDLLEQPKEPKLYKEPNKLLLF